MSRGDYRFTGADISECGKYRYRLIRRWSDFGDVTFVMLNPSTADANHDDPTIRRCAGFARKWGYGGIVVVNLFALRATDPRQLSKVPDPIGPNNHAILQEAIRAGATIVAWGNRVPRHYWRWAQEVGEWAIGCAYFGRTSVGHPKHPLYLPTETEVQRWLGY